MVYGFIGTGTISEAMIQGLMASDCADLEIIVSPRSEVVSSRLAARYENVRVGQSNQNVVDSCDVLILAVRWQVAESVLRELVIPERLKIISVIAATDHASLAAWTGVSVERIVRAIPLPFVAQREGATAIYPADADATELFDAMGVAVSCETKAEFDLLAAASSLMGTYFGILEQVNGWMESKGMAHATAQSYLKPLFTSLSNFACQSSGSDYASLRNEFSTKGGLNEQVYRTFDAQGGNRILIDALNQVLSKIQS